MPHTPADVLADSRRSYWRLINFGVVAVARATRAGPDEPLLLRCECGAAGCVERVAVTRGEYERAARPIVGAAHAGAAASRRASR